MTKKIYLAISVYCVLHCVDSSAQVHLGDAGIGFGQVIQIYTRFHTFDGHPSWSLIIRDVDHNQNIPYIFDVSRGKNAWVAFTYGRNYEIIASNLQFSPYRINPYRYKKTSNFCNLETMGRIIRGKSLYVTIEGNLTPNRDTYTCHVSSYADAHFTIVRPNDD